MFFVYIVTNAQNGTLYIGHTDDLARRAWEHRHSLIEGFSKKYSCTRLVWFELHETRDSAFRRERQMKEWNRKWKLRQIEKINPDWTDLYPNLSDHTVFQERRRYNPDQL